MRRLVLVLYNILTVPLLFIGFLVLSRFNSKVRRGIEARKKIIHKTRAALSQVQADRPRIWIHVSSLGEFLQVKPVLQQLKKIDPKLFIIVSFFSPSGFEHVHDQPAFDYKCYLPFDSYFQAKKFVAVIAPKIAVIVRHDIWPNFVYRLSHEKIPLVLIDASLPQKSSRMMPILRQINKYLFSCMKAICAISEEEAEKLRRIVDTPEKILVTGDTKYDQVFERSKNLDAIAPFLQEPNFKQKKIFVVGSSWPMDEEQIIPAFAQLCHKFDDLIMILAPHEPLPHRIEEIENRLQQVQLTSTRLSQFKSGEFNARCLIIDQVGLLANIYYLGCVSFVGGSFHYKIHNVLEPAIYGLPVLFGPKMKNSSEAQYLLNHDAAILVNSRQEIEQVLIRLLENPDLAQQYGQRARQIVMQNVGSSEKIAQLLMRYL